MIGICSRYIHTHASMIHIDDYAAARELIGKLVRSCDKTTFETLIKTVDGRSWNGKGCCHESFSISFLHRRKVIILKIAVGSKNPAKVSAVLGVYEDAEIISLQVESGVPEQPFSDEETMEGHDTCPELLDTQ